MRSEELATWVSRLKEAHVGCIGDVMLDRFVYGAVERISPEGPIPVLRIESEIVTLGGMGNVARNLASLGAHFQVVCAVGGDSAGDDIKRLLQDLKTGDVHVLTVNERVTTVKTRYIACGQQMLRVDRESDILSDTTLYSQIIDQNLNVLDAQVIVLSDYGKGILTKEVNLAIFNRAKQRKQTVIVDPKGNDYSIYEGATIVTPNRLELSQATGMQVKTDQDIIAAARHLITNFGFEAVVSTLSERGMMLVTQDGNAEHLPAEAREVYDVSGAGDTVVATVAAALSIGLPLLQAAKLANVAAGIVVGKVGTAVVTANELFHTLRSFDVIAAEQKEVSINELEKQLQLWRIEGKKIGFTNGCFDLLHPGHVTLLTKAAAKVDRLVVGLNSDKSIQRLKGVERPIQNELARATVLTSLASVGLVVIFEEDTPQKLIEIVRPDVLVKGADYTVENVVGADFVQSYGGEVMLVDLVPEQSTTRLVREIHSKA
jgi:D-beta-D-heptose 7-phosphate kinase / D-beta-D-heptose 1-phosphate adenosyltransferase